MSNITIMRDYNGNLITTVEEQDIFESVAYADWQVEQEISQYDALLAECERLKEQGLECDFCRPIVCTNETNCVCTDCLVLPF